MTPDEFKIRFPQFAATDITVIQTAIDDADPFFNVCRWGGFYEAGLGNFVAHTLVEASMPVDDGSGSASATVSKAVGDVSVSYASAILDRFASDPWMRTRYGQRYRYLARMVGMGAVAV